MRIWSFQPRTVADSVARGETFRCDPKLAECYNIDESFQESYAWMIERMDERLVRPEAVDLPVWGWHRNYGANKKPDRRRGLYRNYDKKHWALMELEVPAHEVLLSDFDDWHCVLNDCPNLSDEMWETLSDDALDSITQEEKLSSWLDIFNNTDDKEHVQACFWEIRPEYLKKVW